MRVLRYVVAIHLAASWLQAASAGEFLAGTPWGLLHRRVGWLIGALAVVQVLVAWTVRDTHRAARALLVSSLALALAEALQFGTGHFRLFRIHLPIGLLIFGGLVWQLASLGRRGSDVTTEAQAEPGLTRRPTRPSSRQALTRWTFLGVVLVIAQIVLGVGHRLRLWDVVPHMLGAFASSIVLLTVCTLIQRPGSSPRVVRASQMTMAVLLIQVAAGIALWFMTLLGAAGSHAGIAVEIVHSAGGAFTLAATIALTLRMTDESP